MLARANRLISGDEFQVVSRRGRRMQTDHLVVSVLSTDPTHPARFGFTMTRKTGNAVARNRVRRRLRAIAWKLVQDGSRGMDVVVRGLPGSATTDWDTLHEEFTRAMRSERSTSR
ncbi:MAG: ribonuclease P protein component [Cryobacterium sp.]|nr:ribonuclease P protein component [Cryobacterium sp.]